MDLFLTEHNGEYMLTPYGYAAIIVIVLLALVVVFLVTAKKEKATKKFETRKIAFCSMALAAGFATSYIKLFSLPFGGSVTLLSMLFITLTGYWYGLKTGILVAFTYGLMQFLQGPYIISFWQVGFDYLFAFTALGLSGLFKDKKHGLITGYIVAIISRGLLHSIGGYLFFMDWIPDKFPAKLTAIYPLVYNYSYILSEGVITVLVLLIPSVKKAIDNVRDMTDMTTTA